MSKKNKRIDINLVVAIGVLTASFAALFVYVRQATIMGEQTKILLDQSKSSVWPNLSIVMNRNVQATGIEGFNIQISNRGIGPAIIESTVIRYNGKAVTNWASFYNAINVPDGIIRAHSNDMIYDRVIRPNEDFNFINWTSNKALMKYVYKYANRISIEICYKSVYGDYWSVKRLGLKTNLEKNIRVQTDKCELTNITQFVE